MVAGKNFGLGSSRPVAALFTELGVAGLVAEEFNSLFFRNAVNAGLPAMTMPDATTVFHEGDTGTFDLPHRRVAQRDHRGVGVGSQAARPDSRHHRQRRRHAAAGRAGLPARRTGRPAALQHGGDARRGKRRVMGAVGRLLRNVRAGEHRSPLAGAGFAAPYGITVTSTAFTDGGAMPTASAGKGVGDNRHRSCAGLGCRHETRQLVLIIDDVDVPLPRPLLHTIAVIEPDVQDVDAGALQPGTAGMRFIRAVWGTAATPGPRPIPGHGPHHYRFHVFALDEPIPDDVTTAKALLSRWPDTCSPAGC